MKCLRISQRVPIHSGECSTQPIKRHPNDGRGEDRRGAESLDDERNASARQRWKDGNKNDRQQEKWIGEPRRNAAVMNHRVRQPPARSVKEDQSPEQPEAEGRAISGSRRYSEEQRN